METLKGVIDRGAKMCDGQKELASRIGTNASNLSAAKSGKRSLTARQIHALAQVLGMDSGELWKLCLQARNEAQGQNQATRRSLND